MKSYILSIVIAAIICSISTSLLDGQKSAGKIARILSGVLMTVVLLTPLKRFSFELIPSYLDDITADAQAYVDEGKLSAQQDTAALIKEHTEAYILDKAKTMCLDISVEVHLDDYNSIPCGVTLSGKLAPYEKSVLCNYIEQTLGITEEYQQWN